MAIIAPTPDSRRRARDLERLAETRRRTIMMAEIADVSNDRTVEVLAGYSAGTVDLDHALRELQLHYVELCRIVERQEADQYARTVAA